MLLSKRYILVLFIAWLGVGLIAFALSKLVSGNHATFLFLTAVSSWTLFPVMHFVAAALAARKHGRDPTMTFSLIMVAGIILLLLLVMNANRM